MAQAARLNLRLQKELKLLMTDPPPGASFPSLSSSSSSSLSSLDAQIEGPEGSVYANGVFKLKIQIPDRYPFQPPIVTFATPIYHPNIDNGGRICLDILNLPPKKKGIPRVLIINKGAWQPSLNISTVLTSIGLLLSEPNPDDGLMHEASKEYKYNRQAFDQKARSMTEKYAKPIESENANGDEVNQSILNATSPPMEAKDMDVSTCETNKGIVNNKSICGTNRKLSLELLGPNPKRNRSKEVDEESVNHLAHNQIGTGESEQISQGYQVDTAELEQIPKPKTSQFHQNHEKLPETEQKSSLKLLSPSEERNNEDSVLPNEYSSFRESGSFSRGSSKSLSLQQDVNNLKQHPDQDEAGKPTSDCINASSETLLLADEKLMPLDLSHSMGDGPGKMFTASQQSSFVSSSSMSHQTMSVTQISSHLEKQYHNSAVNGNGNGFMNSSHKKKLGLAGRRLRLGFVGSLQSKPHDNKKNLISDPPSNHSVTFSMSMMPEAGEKENSLTTSVPQKKLCGITFKQPLKPLEQLQSNDDNAKIKMQSESQAISKFDPLPLSGNSRLDKKLHREEDHDVKFIDRIKQQEGSPVSESIVVLDSEDSEDETEVSVRCKFSLPRKRLLQKRKAKV